MKASRAPGPVQSSYVKLHQQKKEPKAAPKKGGGVVETGAGGKLNKFKDLDDIPDFPAGDDFDWGDNNNNNNRRKEVDEEEEDDRHWNAHPDNYNSNQQYNRNQYDEEEEAGEQDDEYYQPPSKGYSQQQQQPPPLPAQQQQNNKNNRQSPRPAVQSSSEPKNTHQTNIQQQSKVSVPQKKGSPVNKNPKNRGNNYRDDDEDDDVDDNNNGYYQHNLPKHANIPSNNKNQLPEKDINSIPIPKKKHEYQEGGHPLQINHQMNAPPPLPYEQVIESPPKVVPEKEKLFYSKEPRKVEYR
jgi:hypothetical protein